MSINQRWFLDQIQRWKNVDFGLTLKHNFVLISWSLKNYNVYINVEKINVFRGRNNVCLSTVNQRQKSTLLSNNIMLEKSKSFYNVEMITVFQRRNKVRLSTLSQCRNLKLKQYWFRVDHKNVFVFMFCSNFDGQITEAI